MSNVEAEGRGSLVRRRNVKRFRVGLVFKAHSLFWYHSTLVSLNSRLESNKEEKKKVRGRVGTSEELVGGLDLPEKHCKRVAYLSNPATSTSAYRDTSLIKSIPTQIRQLILNVSNSKA